MDDGMIIPWNRKSGQLLPIVRFDCYPFVECLSKRAEKQTCESTEFSKQSKLLSRLGLLRGDRSRIHEAQDYLLRRSRHADLSGASCRRRLCRSGATKWKQIDRGRDWTTLSRSIHQRGDARPRSRLADQRGT